MKNIVGQTPRGKDFFPRNKIIKKIYRRLDAGSHIFIAAPRRVGKTAIMRFLEEHPQENYLFIYVITESVNDIEEFYQVLLEKILKSKAIGRLVKTKDNIKNLIKDISAKINLFGVSIEIDGQEEKSSFQTQFEQLLTRLEMADERIIIMIDEFPQTVENINKKHGNMLAEKFLRQNREHRQNAVHNIRFLYTGSIGLPMVVQKITSTSVINDLNVVEVPPLNREKAHEMLKILLQTQDVLIETTAIEYALDKIEWFIPFHIQLMAQELIDVFEDTEQKLTHSTVDKAYKQLFNHRNNIYFNHYHSRLEDAFQAAEYDFVIAVLCEIAKQAILSDRKILNIAKRYQITESYSNIIKSLIFDGYINEQKKGYAFNSHILKTWWVKNVKC